MSLDGEKIYIERETGQRDGAWTLGIPEDGREHKVLFAEVRLSKTEQLPCDNTQQEDTI